MNRNPFLFNSLEIENKELSVSCLDDTHLTKELCVLKSNIVNISVDETDLDVSEIKKVKEFKVDDTSALLLPLDSSDNFLSDWSKITENDLYENCDAVLGAK